MQRLVPGVALSVRLRGMIRDMADQVILTAVGTLVPRGKGYVSETTIVVAGPKNLATGDPDLTK